MRPQKGPKGILRLVGVGICSAAAVSAADGATKYVDGTVSSSGDGLSWPNAKKTIQEGVTIAAAGEEVHVADGVYKPASQGTSIKLKDQVSIQGGYIGNNGLIDPDTRNVLLYVTYISGDISGNDGANFSNYGDNAYHVVLAAVADNVGTPTQSGDYWDQANLDGFTIVGGNSGDVGGGILIEDDSTVVIRGCTITLSYALASGGGAFCEAGSLPVFRNCIFTGNKAASTGGGMRSEAPALLLNCTFTGNKAGSGAGVCVAEIEDVQMINCRLDDNTCLGGDAEPGSGGGLFVHNGTATLTNCLVTNNNALVVGGGIFTRGGEVACTNCTIADNEADGITTIGGGIFSDTTLVLVNCIVWNNAADTDPQVSPASGATVTYTDVMDGYTGMGNVDDAPLFVGSGDYHLQCGTLCINLGHNDSVPVDDEDVDENADSGEKTPDLDFAKRIVNVVDMGAYELPSATDCPADINEDGCVNTADLLVVINTWGPCASCASDVSSFPCKDGYVNTADLLLIVNSWGHCEGYSCDPPPFSTVQDCMDAASEIYEYASPEWNDYVEKCSDTLRAGGYID